jgi:hypothetical protein
MRFLQSPFISRVDNYDKFCYSNKTAMEIFKEQEIMHHLYDGHSLANTNTSANNILSVATDDMTLANKLQNAISAVSVVQISTLKTAKEFEF